MIWAQTVLQGNKQWPIACEKVNLIVWYFSYLQAILEEHGAKSQPQRPGSGGDVAQSNGKGVKIKLPVSQVDIMQMLSKAQQEYDTVSSNVCLLFAYCVELYEP